MPYTLPLLWILSASPAPAAPPKNAPAATWETTLDRVIPSVVAIRVTGTREFDTENAGTGVGTGFIIDAENGLILTNRHMVHAGPVIAEAVFQDHEEIPLEPIYRDPVHDFGVYRFDPKLVKHMDVVALSLDPAAARVGLDIRVIGNDAGEKISILDGTLARLDRAAPVYGDNTYNDFNTFYLQAASNTSGGSSGSPVVNLDGRVVALNAGGSTKAASSFYLPLDRVVAALDHIRREEPVPRGTLQAVFEYKPYDELRRLGLSATEETALRNQFPEATGALVVAETLPEGPASGVLLPGDILLAADGEPLASFVPLEARLDARVGSSVTLKIERGGTPLSVDVGVQDLHRISPASYLEVSRSILHDLSFQQARNHGIPVRGVFVASPGYWLSDAGIPDDAVITAVNGTIVDDLTAFQAEIEKHPDGTRVPVRWFAVAEPRQSQLTVARIDRRWFAMKRCSRDDRQGLWPCVDSPPPPPVVPPPVESAPLPAAPTKMAKKLAASFVRVDFDIPHMTAGIKDTRFSGTGLIVNVEKGLILVDRDTVPVGLGDITLTFGGVLRIPGRLVYLHPTHNFAILAYDPKQIGSTPVQAIVWSSRPAKVGDPVWQVGLDRENEVVSAATKVKQIDELGLPIPPTPRFRDSNVEVFTIEDSRPSLGGVVVNKQGEAVASWASFRDPKSGNAALYGLPARYIEPSVEALVAGEAPVYYGLGAEFGRITLADARDRGLPAEEIQALLSLDPDARTALVVSRLWGGSPASRVLKTGDLVLAIQGKPVSKIGELESFSALPQISFRLAREGAVQKVTFDTVPLDGNGTDRIVVWAGAILHEAHPEVAMQQGLNPGGVYVAFQWYGGPAQKYRLRPSLRIVEVDGTAVANLDQLVTQVSGKKHGEAVRIRALGLDGKPEVLTLKLDLMYWPTTIVERKNGEWERRELPRVDEILP